MNLAWHTSSLWQPNSTEACADNTEHKHSATHLAQMGDTADP